MWKPVIPAIASVSASLVTAVAPGTAQGIAPAGWWEAADTVEVSLTHAPAELELDASTVTLHLGPYTQVTAAAPDSSEFQLGDRSAARAAISRMAVFVMDDGPAGSAAVWYEQEWSYSSTSSLLADPALDDSPTRGDGRMELVTGLSGTPWGGSTALRRNWPTGIGGAPEVGLRIELPNADDRRITEMWVEIYANFGGHDQGGRTGDKVLFFQDEDFNRWDAMQATGGRIVSSGGTSGIIADGIQPFWSTSYPSGSLLSFPNEFVGVPRWHRLRFHVRMGLGASDGEITAWVDDRTVMRGTRLRTNDTGDYWKYIQIGANAAAGSGAYQDFGRVRVFDSAPGW